MTDKPILLLNEKLELSKEGEDYIKSLGDKKLSIIAVIGPKSSGKSFLSNQLVGIFNNGFEIGSLQNKNECCTKGLWTWGKPVSQDNKNILILDVQGFQTESEEQINLNQKFFNLINLISSNVIYNYKKDDESEQNNEINESVLKNSIDFFTKLIQNENLNLDVKNIPNLSWVYRDYNTNDTNKYFDMINSQLKSCENYEKYFKNKIKIFTLPAPMEENDMLINLYLDEDEDPFEEEYKKKLIEFKKIIFGECNDNMTGTELLKLINNFNNPKAKIEVAINKEEIDQISNVIVNELKNKLKEKNGNINDIINKCKNSFDILSDKTLNAFNDKYPQNEYFIEKISDIINIYGKELIKNYLQNKISDYEESIKNIISQKEGSSPLSNEIQKKDDIKSFYENFLEETKKDINEIIFNSKNEFLSCFPEIKNYFEKCVFNHLIKYIDNINNFIISSDNANKEISDQKQKIDELKNEINNLNNIKQNLESKEKEYLSNIESQKQILEKLEQEKSELNNQSNNLTKEKSELEEKNKSLESQLSEITNKNAELTSKLNEYIEKEKAKPKPLLLNIKEEEMPKLVSLFSEIQTTSKEFNETIKSFLQKKSSIFHTQFIEETKLDTDKKCQNWVEELQKITKERFDSKDNYYVKEMDKLKDEKNALNEELNKIKEEVQKSKDENNILKEQMKLVKDIQESVDKNKAENEKIVNTLKNTNELYQKRIKDFDEKMNDMEFNLSNYKFESKMKEEEIDSTFNLFKSMIEKNKKNFENNLKKVPDHIKNEVLNLNKKYKYIKM
jgi:methyl-accepting chemotaxis protein